MPHSQRAVLDEILLSDELPSPSGVALEILTLTRDEKASTTRLGRVLTADPALAGQILKYANSAQVRTGKEVRSVNEAVVRLGLTTVRQLALGFSLLSRVRSGPCANFDYNRFWIESLAAAVCGQTLGRHLPGTSPDEAFTCGLLGRIGRLCLASVHPEAYGQVLRRWRDGSPEQLLQLEREALSVDHDAVTVALFADWGLPESYREAVSSRDAADGGRDLPAARRTLPQLLDLSRQLAVVCTAQPRQRESLARELVRRGTDLGLGMDALAAGCEQALAEWQRMGQVLDLIVGDVPPIQELVARAGGGEAADRDDRPPADPGPQVVEAQGERRGQGLRILLVAADPGDRDGIGAMLADEGHAIVRAEDGREALRLVLETGPQVVIADWEMPGLSGREVCAALRQSKETAHTHAIVLMDRAENAWIVDALRAGADDHVVRPVDRQILVARLDAARRLIGLREQVEQDREEIRRFAAQQAVLNRKLQRMALHDELTGIGNRRAAMEHLQREWGDVQRHRRPLVCMLIDIDHFKQVNDTYGHDVGDAVLRETARVMTAGLRTGDIVCRFGGEEFLAICPDTDLDAAGQVGDRLRAAVEGNTVAVPGFTGHVTVSVGVAHHAPGMASITELLKLADEALYAAKDAGRNKVCLMNLEAPAV